MAHTLFADPYAIFGLKVGRNEDVGFSWFVEGRNLADRTYAATTRRDRRRAGDSTPRSSCRAMGERYYAGVSWKPK